MSVAAYAQARSRTLLLAHEVAKIAAFVRRDFLVALSYRGAFAMDVVNLAIQAATFWFIGKMVDPATLPSYGGSRATYMEFAAIGMVLSLVIALLLERVATAVRQEQMIGTFESLLATPTAAATIQVGSAAFDLLYVPIRAAVFLLIIAVGFGLDFDANGVLPAFAVLLAFVPFVWGLGLLSAAAMVTFRRGGGGVMIGATILALLSGAYFPIDLLPGWLQAIASVNPIAIAIDGVRQALLGGDGWAGLDPEVLLLVPMAAVSLTAGVFAFRLGLARERRNGTLGLY
ncbi:MAG TPA: ABC transporter permease [Solirubrobacteraceae bacterium]|jgi:ABC-2 type transport system permease protein